jgi:hypothetical protein
VPEAKYTILVPLQDDRGNQLVPLSPYARQYLQNIGISDKVYTEPSKHDGTIDLETLVVLAEDNPMADSSIKQTAHYLAELVNSWGIICIKEGKDGVKTWQIANTNYRPDEPADPKVLSQPETKDTTSLDQLEQPASPEAISPPA